MNLLRFWCQKVIPLVYDDSLSYYELLCKVVKYINELIEQDRVFAGEIDELKKGLIALENWLKNLDLQDEVNNKIEQLLRDGLLDDVIDETFKKFNFYEVADMYPCFQTFDTINPVPKQLNAQGMCIAVIDNVPVICTTLVNSDNTECQVYLHNVSSGEEIYKVSDDRFGHANGVTYYNRKFYFTSPKGGEKKVATLDFDTKEIAIVDVDVSGLDNLHGMDYDSVTDTFICRGNYNNANRLFTMNTSLTEVLSYSSEIKYNYNGRYEQSIKCDGDFIYVIDGRGTRDNVGCLGKISVYDRKFHLVSTVLTPSTYELEDIAFYNGECYFYILSYGVGCTMVGSLNPSQNMYGTHMSVYEYNEINRYASSQNIYLGWSRCRFKCDGTINFPFFGTLFSTVIISKNFHHVNFVFTEDLGTTDFPLDIGLSMNAINIKRVDILMEGHTLYGDVFGSIELIRVVNGTINFITAQFRPYAIQSEGKLELLQITIRNCGSATPIVCFNDLIINGFSSDTTSDYDVIGNFKTRVRYQGASKLHFENIDYVMSNDYNLDGITSHSNTAKTLRGLVNGTDLNNVYLSGTYYLDEDYTFVNLPTTGIKQLDVYQCGTIVRQLATTRGAYTGELKMYTRDIILDGFPARNFTPYIGVWHKIIDETLEG